MHKKIRKEENNENNTNFLNTDFVYRKILNT